ncbi:MAG TPA: hypothetical protein VM261_28245 [Kofleriaceae bacterium]|nr:hypothetical protein [Kofleriaceae bacterium]
MSRRLYFSTFLLLTMAACSGGGDDDGGGPDAVSASCMEATTRDDLAWLQEKIFTPSCSAFTACHMGTALEAGGLSLEAGQVIPQTVNVDSDLFPQFKLVVPGNAANSYMMMILGDAAGPLDPEVGTMPYNNPRLCQEKLDAIERWINAGATENASVDAGVDAVGDATVR